MADLKVGERIVGRRAVALNGEELLRALQAGLEECMEEIGASKGYREDTRQEVGWEFEKCPGLGKAHLAFPAISWRIEVGLEEEDAPRRGLWTEISVWDGGRLLWYMQTGVLDFERRERFAERRQERTEVPDEIRRRWGLGASVEVRGADGKLGSREIKFGGPRGGRTDSQETIAEPAVVEPESPQETILTLKEGVGSLGAARIDKAGGREFVKLDKEDLVAEPPAPEVKQPASVESQSAPSGVKIRGKGGRGRDF